MICRLSILHSHVVPAQPQPATGGAPSSPTSTQAGQFRCDGGLLPHVLDEFEREGYVTLHNVISSAELAELRAEVQRILIRAPVSKGLAVDSEGRPTLTSPSKFQFAPASRATMDRQHELELRKAEPQPGQVEYPVKISSWLEFSVPGLRLYGHPKLLSAAASVNGPSFTPFSESLVIKHAGHGAALAWHQDGGTHWDDGPQLAEHGFNYMCNMWNCTAENALWVVPRSHRLGRVNIPEALSDGCRLPNAVPLLCRAGDVAMVSTATPYVLLVTPGKTAYSTLGFIHLQFERPQVNRNAVHGSFANSSEHARHTWIFGFHKRSAVDGIYPPEAIELRRRLIPLASDCRAQVCNQPQW